MKPRLYDFYCGLGGWTEAFLAEGWDCIGFDIERHDYGSGGYPGQLVLQDVCTIHGAQLIDADCLVASSPCQEFSYRAMPWKRAKALGPPVLGINLFWQAFRIQHEIYEACGRHVPLVAENVKGAQPWIGRAAWHYGSFYLWGDMPALMPSANRLAKVPGLNWSGSDKPGYVAKAFNDTAIKNQGGSWFGIGSPGQKALGQNPVHEGSKTIFIPGQQSSSWFGKGNKTFMRSTSSGSRARKAASAQIAKIPQPLAQWIARTYKPSVEVCA